MSRSKFFAACLFACSLLFASAPAKADKISKKTLDLKGEKRTYYLYVPDSAKGQSSVPLIVLLHGSGRDGLSLVEKWKDLAERENLIVVGPNSKNSQMWSTDGDGPEFFGDLVEKLKSELPVDGRRVYLFGHSAGAVYALNLSMVESEYYAATAFHAGSWRDQSGPSVIQYAKRKTPLAMFVGDRDAYFPLESVRETEAVLKRQNFPVELTVIPNHTHWYYDRAPEINRQAWDFLKKHVLPGEPKRSQLQSTDDTQTANAAIQAINQLRNQANDLMQRFHAVDATLTKIDSRDQDAQVKLAREEVVILNESAAKLREAALKADEAGKINEGKYAQFFALVAQLERKRAESVEALRERAVILTEVLPPETKVIKRNEALRRSQKLQGEADELEQQAERARVN